MICYLGLKESKLGVLAESKLTPSSGSVVAATNGVAASVEAAKTPQTFNFTPLTKPSDEVSKSKSTTADVENKNPNLDDSKPTEKFVFGQNLTERVENVDANDSEVAAADASGETDTKPSSTSTDSPSKDSIDKSSLLFSNSVSPNPKEDEESKKNNAKTLSESAAEYTESHSNKRKYDVVDVVTGEEEESNVLKANVKLYIFDSDKKNWVERGRGMLRLNDDPTSTVGHLRYLQ